ncbi:hypothetical protein [Pelagicoccus sp. SDUM812003]|uniref:hypothetical protein n=1 Tax=Pelagicoccus sp. SDUM812003 TaxID=3041267 RepID=UPI00281070C0|nr:hypothetical protein [Pelagicoccus sp. SDUM812003]MDQ8203746.1 hypothetical protein [Pelagicoccus sp. SDUM812003]
MKTRIPAFILIFALGGISGFLASSYFQTVERQDVSDAVVVEKASEDGTPLRGIGASYASDSADGASYEDALSFQERIDRAMDHDSYRRRQYELERLFENLSSEEAPQMLAKILEISEPRLRGDLLRPFFVKWGELDGPIAYKIASEMKGRNRTDSVSAVLAGWAHTDVHASWEAAKELMEGGGNSFVQLRLTRGSVMELAKQDPDLLLQYIAEDTENRRFDAFSRFLVDAAFEEERQGQLLAKLSQIENGEDRAKLISQVYHRWGVLDTEAPLNALSQIDDPQEAKGALEGFLRGWVESDVEGALNFAFANYDDPAVKSAFPDMLQQTFRDGSAEQSLELVDRLSEEGLLAEVGMEVSRTLAFIQPQIALKISDSIPNEVERNNIRMRAVSHLARNDFAAAVTYYEKEESVEQRARYLPSMAWSLTGRSDGGAKLAQLLEGIPSGESRSRSLEQILTAATRPGTRMSDDFREALSLIAESEAGLSEQAKALSEKLRAPGS